MDVYTFEKSFLERLKEAEAVLSWDDAVMPASQVRTEWKSYLELQLEPAGWQAVWKIPRVICEALKLRFPTIVYGYVDQVIFDELKAVFVVTAVQDDVHLPERNEVSLIELWPTLQQENSALNVETTAECIDRLRFFYAHVWLPWDKDHDDDRDWVKMHLQARIQLACDLSKHRLPRPLALHIRSLLAEARYIQQRLEYLELDLSDAEAELESDNEELEPINSPVRKQSKTGGGDGVNLNKSNLPVSDLMCLHLRLAIIRSEFEILENPEMRRAYSELQSNSLKRHLLPRSPGQPIGNPPAHMCYLVSLPCELQQQMSLLALAKQHVKKQRMVQLGCNLQDVLSICQPTDDILLSPGRHTIKFLEQLNDKGSISGLLKEPRAAVLSESESEEQLAVVCSSDEDSTLLVIDSDFTLSQLLLDCRHVRRGILLRGGTLRLRGCRLLGDGCSSTQEGIVCLPHSQLALEDCVLQNFAVGISLQAQAGAELNATNLKNCNLGLELLDKSVELKLQGSQCNFTGCKLGILADGIAVPNSTEKAIVLARYSELQSLNVDNWLGSCSFKDCLRNVRVLNESEQLLARRTQDCLKNENEGENKNIN